MPGSRSNRERIATQNAAQGQSGASLIGTGSVDQGTGPATRPGLVRSIISGYTGGIVGNAAGKAAQGAADALGKVFENKAPVGTPQQAIGPPDPGTVQGKFQQQRATAQRGIDAAQRNQAAIAAARKKQQGGLKLGGIQLF